VDVKQTTFGVSIGEVCGVDDDASRRTVSSVRSTNDNDDDYS
jgi:hypothetical protein